MTVGAGRRAGLLDEAVTVRVWISLEAPEVMPERLTVWGPAFSLRVRPAIGLSVGRALTGLTVTVKERIMVLLEAAPLSTMTVIETEP